MRAESFWGSLRIEIPPPPSTPTITPTPWLDGKSLAGTPTMSPSLSPSLSPSPLYINCLAFSLLFLSVCLSPLYNYIMSCMQCIHTHRQTDTRTHIHIDHGYIYEIQRQFYPFYPYLYAHTLFLRSWKESRKASRWSSKDTGPLYTPPRLGIKLHLAATVELMILNQIYISLSGYPGTGYCTEMEGVSG